MNLPNIIYINSHDTGRYIQPYGHPVPTPNLQRFAESATLFRKCFCAAPTCSPSRATLLTGQAPHSSGMLGLAHRGWPLNDYTQHWVHALHQAGYTSYFTGVQHIATDTKQIGYHNILHASGQDGWSEAAAQFLRSKPAAPFYLEVGFGATHREYPEPGSEDDPRYVMPPAILPDTPQTRRDFAAYRACARKLDELMGRVFDALDESGLANGTLVICTTDHGIAFPSMKCNLTDHGIGVMLMMRGSGGFDAGKVIDGMVSHIDIFPTLCELLEIPAPSWLQGRSFMPLVRGEADEINDAVFAEVSYHAAYEPMRCVRTKRWKYIRRIGDTVKVNMPNCDDSLSKDVWLEHGWRSHQNQIEELYDLVFDPAERRNLAGITQYEDVLREMRELLDRRMIETSDPFVNGWIEPREGAFVTDANALSPRDEIGMRWICTGVKKRK